MNKIIPTTRSELRAKLLASSVLTDGTLRSLAVAAGNAVVPAGGQSNAVGFNANATSTAATAYDADGFSCLAAAAG